jgi:hypothetical protein
VVFRSAAEIALQVQLKWHPEVRPAQQLDLLSTKEPFDHANIKMSTPLLLAVLEKSWRRKIQNWKQALNFSEMKSSHKCTYTVF